MVLLGILLTSCSVATTTQPEDRATQPTGASSRQASRQNRLRPQRSGLPIQRDVSGCQIDPRTLEPVDASAPITTGDWLAGQTSRNGDWLALTKSGEIISSINGPEYLTIFGESGLLATSVE